MLNMGHETLVFQILRTQIISNMPCEGWSRAQCWQKCQWISQRLSPRRHVLPSLDPKGQIWAAGKLYSLLISLSPQKAHCCSVKLVSRHLFSYFTPSQWPCAGPSTEGAWPTAAFPPCLLWIAPNGLNGIFHFPGSEPWPGRAFRFTSKDCPNLWVPAVALEHHWASRKAHKGASCNIRTPSKHIPYVPVGFGWGDGWPRTRRQTHSQNPAHVTRALQGTGWGNLP